MSEAETKDKRRLRLLSSSPRKVRTKSSKLDLTLIGWVRILILCKGERAGGGTARRSVPRDVAVSPAEDSRLHVPGVPGPERCLARTSGTILATPQLVGSLGLEDDLREEGYVSLRRPERCHRQDLGYGNPTAGRLPRTRGRLELWELWGGSLCHCM